MTSNRPYLIRAVYEWICDNGLTPYLLVDAQVPGVRVPPQAVRDGKVVLNLAPRAVSQLNMGNDVIEFMARFGGVSQSVLLPVEAVQAVYAQESGQGMMMPPEPQTEEDDDGPLQDEPPQQTLLTPVEGHDPGPGDRPDPPRRGHLRVVK